MYISQNQLLNLFSYQTYMNRLLWPLLFSSSLYGMLGKIPKHYTSAKKSFSIVPYDNRYLDHLQVIARTEITRLATVLPSEHTARHYKKLVEKEVVSALNSKAAYSKVCLKEEVPVAFITYALHGSWYNKLLPASMHNFKAKIYHLAVDKKYQSKGCGSLLLKHVLHELRDKPVSHVHLWMSPEGTSDIRLHKFYAQFGFKMRWLTKRGEQKYELRLKPSLLWTALQSLSAKKASSH